MTVVSGHQPAYLPWLGLLHKASLCDVFVYMDDVQFLDRDFIHRNRIRTPDGRALWLTVPVDRAGSQSRRIRDMRIARTGRDARWQERHWASLQSCYGATRYFSKYADFFRWLYIEQEWWNVSQLNLAIWKQALAWFGLTPEIVIASDMDFRGRKSDLVLEHALRLGADHVLTGSQGRNYIRHADFEAKGIRVTHQEYAHPVYGQMGPFMPCLSFVDLLFRHGPDSAEMAFSGNRKKGE